MNDKVHNLGSTTCGSFQNFQQPQPPLHEILLETKESISHPRPVTGLGETLSPKSHKIKKAQQPAGLISTALKQNET